MIRTAMLAFLSAVPRFGEGEGDGGAGGAGGAGAGSGSGQGDGGQGGQGGAAGGGGGTPTFDEWHKALPEDQQRLVDGHITGLKSALDSERTARATLEKDLRDAAATAKDVPELQTKLTGLADQVQAETQRADFFEKAHSAGVSNLRLAWIMAREDKLFKHNGDPDFEALKTKAPELFKTAKAPPANAGTGAGAGAGAGTGTTNAQINSAIRQAAGRAT